jgi:hypothetical protein
MLTQHKTPSCQLSQRVYVDEEWHTNDGGLTVNPREWLTWSVYAIVPDEPTIRIGHFSYEDFDSAIFNACQWAIANGERTVQLRKEGKDTSEIDAAQSLADIKMKLVTDTWQC